MEEDGFSVVRKRKKKTAPSGHFTPTDQYVSKVNLLRDELKCSEFYGQVKDLLTDSFRRSENVNREKEAELCNLLDKCKLSASLTAVENHRIPDKEFDAQKYRIEEFIGYGIGNFASCLIARYQLSLLLCLREDFQVSDGHCKVYDPIFNDIEHEILSKLNVELITENEEGKRKCSQKTLFFMPHCGKALYNNLLWANWSKENLMNIIIIGNSFKSMIDNTPDRLLKKTGNYIILIHDATEETSLPSDIFRYTDIFNDLSIHIFPWHKLRNISDEIWQTDNEPKYDVKDIEIILNKGVKS